MSKDRLYLESIRNLEVIGEATKNLSEDLRDANPSIPWRQIAGMRDVLIHDYLKVNLNRMWRTVEIDLPPLDTVALFGQPKASELYEPLRPLNNSIPVAQLIVLVLEIGHRNRI